MADGDPELADADLALVIHHVYFKHTLCNWESRLVLDFIARPLEEL